MKFKIGDRVVATNSYDGNAISGMEGVIVDLIEETNEWGVDFDKEIDCGHALRGKGRDGYGWYVPGKYLKHILPVSLENI